MTVLKWEFQNISELKNVFLVKKKFSKLVEKYGLVEIENNNNIILFSYNNELYYYALVKHKIRKKGSKEWFTKVTDILK